MKPNIQFILDKCISEGIRNAINGAKQHEVDLNADIIENFIWLEIDSYFTFTDND